MMTEDLRKALDALPNLSQVWEDRVATLEHDREEIWSDLRRAAKSPREAAGTDPEAMYHTLHRLDRSIAFLDRTLARIEHLRPHEAVRSPHARD